MGYKRTAAAASLLSLSFLLAACDAITAQNISSTTTTATAFNNGAGLGGRDAQMGMPGSFDGGGFGGTNGGGLNAVFDADAIGRIVSVSGHTVTLDLVEEGASATGDGAQSPGGAAEGQSEWVTTGESISLTLADDVSISSGSVSRERGGGGRGAGRGSTEGGSAADGTSQGGASAPGGGSANGGGIPTDRSGEAAPSAPSAANGDSGSDVSDLKADQIVMIWYEAGTETVERVRILE